MTIRQVLEGRGTFPLHPRLGLCSVGATVRSLRPKPRFHTGVVSTDTVLLLIVSVIWGLAWLGTLAAVTLVHHCLWGTKAIDVDRFIVRSVRIGVVVVASLVILAVFIWIIWKWKPDFGFWGRFIQPYWQIAEAGLLIGIALMTACLALLSRRRKKKSRAK